MTLHEEFMEILGVLMEAPLAEKKSPAAEKTSIPGRAGESNTQSQNKPRKGAAR